ncbi:amidohydrolase [Tessaracoccus oleiagri]|uniref:Hippurate hydrolase n=1 Tax=Tessaracoccus oleiagri TaxID=686624 RepID=A0A1G9JRM2_9ACTN|nr:amidohydrolase [Tessaracoccus oleiagri]SDL39845.1 hippurate hydrolase [Tessaracoccus oleiagri]
MTDSATTTTGYEAIQEWQEQLYQDLHRNPELSMEESRTVEVVVAQLMEWGYDVKRIGGGVVGTLANGDGPTVLFRADMDALPVEEATGLDYASEAPGVMHACGHDVHVACGLGAARLLAEQKQQWSGTYVALFQPGEETAEGARAMVDAGLADAVPRPDVALGQHVLPGVAGTVSTASGPVLSAGDSIRITVFGNGTHGSMPHLGVDSVVLASSIVMRLQTVVAREIAPGDFGVVTVGAIHAGAKSNIIPDSAELLVNVRTYDDDVRERVLKAIERIVRGECATAGSPEPPSLTYYDQFPLTVSDPSAATVVTTAFEAHFGADKVGHLDPVPASEDFSRIPGAWGDVPYLYWGLGGFSEGAKAVANHNPAFAPTMQPTLRTGTEAAMIAALAYLRPST